MQTQGFGLSAILIATGAILAYAINVEAEGVDINQIGVILMFVGIGLGVITLITAAMGRTTTVDSSREAIVDGRAVVEQDKKVINER